MVWVYDKAISEDLQKSFQSFPDQNTVVRVIDPESAIDVAAQILADNVKFPIVVVNRDPNMQIDQDRYNFTQLHKGVSAVLDSENNLYYEKIIPIKLNYGLTVLTTNTADMDEIVRELLFKYTSMYFLTITVPYESKRKVRFGVTFDSSASIDRQSDSSKYLKTGQLYQTIIPLRCEGCVLVNYTPVHLRRFAYELGIEEPKGLNLV